MTISTYTQRLTDTEIATADLQIFFPTSKIPFFHLTVIQLGCIEYPQKTIPWRTFKAEDMKRRGRKYKADTYQSCPIPLEDRTATMFPVTGKADQAHEGRGIMCLQLISRA